MQHDLPFLSLVIPTFSRPRELAACLASLARLDYPRTSFEVVVVDDGSPQPLDDVVSPFAARLDITLVRQANAGPAAARNAGARRARGDRLVFLDDDCAPAPDYLRVLASRSVAAPDVTFGGRTINALTANPYSTASQILADYLYAYFNAEPSRARFLTSNNMLVPARVFHDLNGFNTGFRLAAGEDRDFCERLLRRGYTIEYAPEAIIYHSHHLTFRKYLRQHFTYGRGAATVHRQRAAAAPDEPSFLPASFYLNLLRYPFSCEPGLRALGVSGLLALSQVATAGGYARERLAARRRVTPAR